MKHTWQGTHLKCIQHRIKTFQNNRRICLQEINLFQEKNQKGSILKERWLKQLFNVGRESRWCVFMTTFSLLSSTFRLSTPTAVTHIFSLNTSNVDPQLEIFFVDFFLFYIALSYILIQK